MILIICLGSKSLDFRQKINERFSLMKIVNHYKMWPKLLTNIPEPGPLISNKKPAK